MTSMPYSHMPATLTREDVETLQQCLDYCAAQGVEIDGMGSLDRYMKHLRSEMDKDVDGWVVSTDCCECKGAVPGCGGSGCCMT